MDYDYKKKEFDLHEYLIRIRQGLQLINSEQSLIKAIDENIELIVSKKYKVAVVGEFKRGKSSLLNALLGENILPSDVTPATSAVNRITYGNETSVRICYKDGKEETVGIDDLIDYVTMLTEKGVVRSEKIKEAVITVPSVLCQNNFDIIDTPGLNDPDVEMTKITLDMVGKVDGLIFTMAGSSPLSDTEVEYIAQFVKCKSIYNIIFVVTRIDEIENCDRVIEYIRKNITKRVFDNLENIDANEDELAHAGELLDNINIYGVSSIEALKAFVTSDANLLRKSRFEAFRTDLMNIVTANQVSSLFKKTRVNVSEVLKKAREVYERTLKKYSVDIDKYQKYRGELEEYYGNSESVLNDSLKYSMSLRDKLLSEISEYENRIKKMFIGNLALIKKPTRSEIINTITLVREQALEKVKNEWGQPVIHNLKQELKKCLYQYEEYRREKFIQPLKIFDINHNDSAIKNMSCYIENAIGRLNFSWEPSFVEDVADIERCNVIVPISKEINISVQKYNVRCKTNIDGIYTFCDGQRKKDIRFIRSLYDYKISEIIRKLELERAVYVKNSEIIFLQMGTFEKEITECI